MTLFPNIDEKRAVSFIRGSNVFIEKQGYLRKLSSSVNKHWNRRWFSLEDGKLYYYRSANEISVADRTLVVNAHICSVRQNTHTQLDYVFDIVSPNKRAYTLQAESLEEYKEWIQVFEHAMESLMMYGTTVRKPKPSTGAPDPEEVLRKEQQELKSQLCKLNPVCADCGERDPDWASINIGVMICITCAGVHRQIGVHITKVRSVTLDSWPTSLLKLMLALGNEKSNHRYQANVPAGLDPITASTGRDDRVEFIQAKYSVKFYLSRDMPACGKEDVEKLHMLMNAAAGDDVDMLADLYALGVDPNRFDQENKGFTALHHAAQHDAMLAVEFLLQNNADQELQDSNGNTAEDIAIANHSLGAMHRLESKKTRMKAAIKKAEKAPERVEYQPGINGDNAGAKRCRANSASGCSSEDESEPRKDASHD